MINHELLVALLRDFARHLVTDYEVGDVLDTLCDSTVEVLPVRGAGVMLEDDSGTLRFVAASDATVQEIERLQIELGEGPCLQAYETGRQVIIPDLRDSPEFPAFAPCAVAASMRGVYSFPMWAGEDRIGALNLYNDELRPFSDEAVETGQTLADAATGYILNARAFQRTTRTSEQLERALHSRVVIEQAKGKLSAQLGVPVEEAFTVLRRYARNNGLKLHPVAADVVEDRLRIEMDDL